MHLPPRSCRFRSASVDAASSEVSRRHRVRPTRWIEMAQATVTNPALPGSLPETGSSADRHADKLAAEQVVGKGEFDCALASSSRARCSVLSTTPKALRSLSSCGSVRAPSGKAVTPGLAITEASAT